MQIKRRFSGTKYQLCIGFIFGFICSFCLNEIFRGSIRKTSESGSEFASEVNNLVTVPSRNSSHHENIRVLCWVLTCPKNHRTQAIHVKRTWGKRCDKLLFVSTQEDSAIDSIVVRGAEEGRDWLWEKTKFAFKYVWERYKDEYDWILKADDDTYVIVENLKKFLSNYSSSDPIFFGCGLQYPQLRNILPPWASGGAGYVLSKEALKRFVLDALPNPKVCYQGHDGSEDMWLGMCLNFVGVKLEDSRDSSGRHRFLFLQPADFLFPKTLTENDKKFWSWTYMTYPREQGMNSCANDAISFHYISSRDMYVMEYFLYHVRPDGVYREQNYVQEYPLEFPELNSTSTQRE